MHFVSLTVESAMFLINPGMIRSITSEIILIAAKNFIYQKTQRDGYASLDIPDWIFYLLCERIPTTDISKIKSLIIWKDDTMIAYIKHDNSNAHNEHTVFVGASVLES